MTLPLTTVFVYGTLMPGERNAHIAVQGGPFSARPARLSGYRLFDLVPEHYPGIVAGTSAEVVQGYALTFAPGHWAQALAALDALEGIHETPPLYTRQQVQLEVEGGHRLAAWVYVYARTARLQAPGVQFMPEGDWRKASHRDQHGADDR